MIFLHHNEMEHCFTEDLFILVMPQKILDVNKLHDYNLNTCLSETRFQPVVWTEEQAAN